MLPNDNLIEKGILIVTGSTVRAEQADRPLAYRLKSHIEELLTNTDDDFIMVVLSDVWYLNADPLRRLPVISIGGPSVNAVSAYLYKQLDSALAVDDTLLIQMDPQLQDLRVSLWGMNQKTTEDALDIFIKRGHLDRFLDAVTNRIENGEEFMI